MQTIITVKSTADGLSVVSPYNVDFVAKAKKLAGKWDSAHKAWMFDPRNETAVRALLVAVYGTDGSSIADTVSVRIALADNISVHTDPIVICGRVIARAYGRDSGAKPGDGVVVETGGFRSGGSVKNWRTEARTGTVIVLHDFPRSAIETARADADVKAIEIIEAKPALDRAALEAERTRLVNRLAEIDGLLKD